MAAASSQLEKYQQARKKKPMTEGYLVNDLVLVRSLGGVGGAGWRVQLEQVVSAPAQRLCGVVHLTSLLVGCWEGQHSPCQHGRGEGRRHGQLQCAWTSNTRPSAWLFLHTDTKL